jgi:hypothetical protein
MFEPRKRIDILSGRLKPCFFGNYEAAAVRLGQTIGPDFEKSRAGWVKKIFSQPFDKKGEFHMKRFF